MDQGPIRPERLSASHRQAPPRLPFILSVGITGHRSAALGDKGITALREQLPAALQLIAESAGRTKAAEGRVFSTDETQLQFISALADGADQIAAEAALALGYSLRAILPFERSDYRTDLDIGDAADRFDALLAKSACVLELPGERAELVEAYVMTGRATVAHADILIAVWDGLKPRGPGGTGDVVEFAIERGTPVIHIPTDRSLAPRVLWAAFDPVVDTLGVDPMAERPLDAAHLDKVLQALLIPPRDKDERKFLAEFESERLGHYRARVEYPLLLAAARVKRFDRRRFVEKTLADEIAGEWRGFRSDCADRHKIDSPLDLLEQTYSWADRLATRYAQTYRSGHVFNFVLGGFAVCLGLSGFMIPAHKFSLSLVEMAITLAIIINTIVGQRGEWHRRWLDYRRLAEQLRPLRSLKLLGIAAPDPPGTMTNPVPERWIDWYAEAAWRAMGCPSGRITPEQAHQIAASIADYEVAPQVGYHERNSKQMRLLDHRLDLVGTALFVATLIVSIVTLVGLAFSEAFVTTLSNWFTLVSAGFPALGTAIFGIRYQGDFGGTANRSQRSAQQLKAIDEELRKKPGLSRAADLTEQAARVMLGDLDEWCLVHQRLDLSV